MVSRRGGARYWAARSGSAAAGLLGQFQYDENGLGLHATQIGILKGGKIVAQ